MSVIHREPPVDSPHPTRSAVLEGILRDAACFATEDEAPEGLAYRALARQIAVQSRLHRLAPVRKRRNQRIGVWFGGLSAGTLAGAAAAILIIAHLNGNAFRITPETASLPTPASRDSGTESSAVGETFVHLKGVPGPGEPRPLATSPAAAGRHPVLEARLPAHHPSEREAPSRSIEWDRAEEQDLPPAPRTLSVVSHTSTPEKAHATPPVARWKTEPFEETEYQLVTAAYTPEPTSGGYTSGRDHLQLTPLKMRASLDQTESDPMAGPSLPQY